MARPFASATAEDVLAAIEAVSVAGKPVEPDYVAAFWGMRSAAADGALRLAVDLGFLAETGGKYAPASPLCRLTRTADVVHKAAVLRLLLDSYLPFTTFRERLVATNNAQTAAEQTRVTLDLDAHRDEVKETLVSLGGFAQALRSEGGGRFVVTSVPHDLHLLAAARACADITSAEMRIRELLTNDVRAITSPVDVVAPLSHAILKAGAGDPRGSIVEAGNAVESYLSEWAARAGVSLVGKHGVNQKVDAMKGSAKLPTKLQNVGYYLGHLRNAADHGVDSDVGGAWNFTDSTGAEYVHVACSFINACRNHELGKAPVV